MEIQVRDVHRKFQVGGADVHALRGIRLDVPQGEFAGIVGVSGSGKSTLMHLVGGLDTADSGQISVAGQEVSKMSQHALAIYRRQVIGFVFQSFYLVPTLSAEQNIRLALTLQGTYGKQRGQLAAEALARVGLSDRANHKPGQLSGGEQQRVTVARAIVNRPRVLLADEPTGNLDQATAQSLVQLLKDIREETGMTILMVTHDQQLANEHCDRVLRMCDGNFVEAISV